MSLRKLSGLFLLLLLSFSLSACEALLKQVGFGTTKDIPLGEYKGTAKVIDKEAKDEKKEFDVAISFLPKEDGYKDAIGILVFNHISDRFLWRSDGNNNNIWNLMFTKDNTMFTNIKDSFEFSGVIKSSEIKNTLEGKLIRLLDEKEETYYINASQIFNPELETPKEALAAKAGEEFTIVASKIDPEKVKVLMQALEGEAELQQVNITNLVTEKDGHSISFSTSKDFKKGKYKVYLEREDGKKSKSIIVEIK